MPPRLIEPLMHIRIPFVAFACGGHPGARAGSDCVVVPAEVVTSAERAL